MKPPDCPVRRRIPAWVAGVVLAFGSSSWAAPPGGPPTQQAGKLIGTIVLEGGRSSAFFAAADGRFRQIREGEALDDGSRLVAVRPDGVVVQRNGAHEQVPLFTFRVRPARTYREPRGRNRRTSR